MLDTEVINRMGRAAERGEDRSNLEYYNAVERTRKDRLLTITWISFFVFGLIVLGIGIFLRMTYNPASFNIAGYTAGDMRAYAIGLSGIVVGALLAAGGMATMVLNRRMQD